jgi:SAM-dependent methyltransferase
LPSPENRDAAETVTTGSAERFGYEWGEYAELRPEYEEQFRRWTVLLPPADWKGKSFLDVGCGMGRNSYWPASWGASAGLAIDIDDRSLASARRTLAKFPHVVVEKRSAYEIGEHDKFDIVFSIGVIHHLAEPEAALKSMVEAARPGGRVLIWVYGLENNRWIVIFLNPLRKALFSRLPIKLVHHLSLYPAAILWLGLQLGVGRIAYFKLIKQWTFRQLRSVVFDQMLPRIANYWSRADVERLMAGSGVESVELSWVNEMSWCALGTKPKDSHSRH